MPDVEITYDAGARRFLLTPRTDKGREFLDLYATAAHERWGKSLMVRMHEVELASDMMDDHKITHTEEY